MQEPGASVEKPSELDEFLCKIDMDPVEETYDEMKNNLTNALTYCKYLLESANLLTNTPSRAISSASVAMGDKIFKEIMRMLGEQKHLINDEKTFNDEDLTIIEQTDSEKEYKERKDVPGNDDPDYVVEQFEGRHNYISLAYKEKTVALAEAHPKWSLQTLQRRGCSLLKKKSLLKQWKEDVERRGTNIDKWKHIETEILERFKKARKCRK
ncbi:PREDICTED: uncharacterized protein LOC105563886 isoform X2 [Vollenhovia emeryi]|nr:PREDICTED: uncharacterized protein LOC105563886 isoform X2 [Vollenhovia emeryi]